MIADAPSRVASLKSKLKDYSNSLSNIERSQYTKSHKQHQPVQKDYKSYVRPLTRIHH